MTASAALFRSPRARLPPLTLHWEEGTLEVLEAWGGDGCLSPSSQVCDVVVSEVLPL